MNRDRQHAENLTPDTLTTTEIHQLDTGGWLGAPLTSVKLNPQHGSGIDPHNLAELSARIRVQLERAV